MMTGLAMKWLIGVSSMVAAVATPLPTLAYEAGAVAGGGSITGLGLPPNAGRGSISLVF